MLRELARVDREVALGRKFGAGRAPGDEHGDAELRRQRFAQCSAASAGPTISSRPSER